MYCTSELRNVKEAVLRKRKFSDRQVEEEKRSEGYASQAAVLDKYIVAVTGESVCPKYLPRFIDRNFGKASFLPGNIHTTPINIYPTTHFLRYV